MKTIFLPLPLTWLQPFDFPHKLGICARLFERILARHGICYVQTAAGIPWKLDLNNTTHRWIVYGKYDPSFLNWAHKFLPPNGVVVDSGANIGQMLLYLAQWVPQGRVLAFEPGTEQASWLEECLTVNTALPVVVLVHPLTKHVFKIWAKLIYLVLGQWFLRPKVNLLKSFDWQMNWHLARSKKLTYGS